MSRLTPELAKSRSRLAGADRRLHDRSRIEAVPLASLPGPQRRLISALLEATKAAAIRRAVPKMAESGAGEEGTLPAAALRPASRKAGTPAEHAVRAAGARSRAARAIRRRSSRRG